MNLIEMLIRGLGTTEIVWLVMKLLKAAPEKVITKLLATFLQHTLRRFGQRLDKATIGSGIRWLVSGVKCVQKNKTAGCKHKVSKRGIDA